MAIDGLVSCRRALEMDREPTDQYMDFWQDPAADLPDADRDNNRPQHIPPSTLRARPSTKKHRLLRCQLCRLCGHDACTRNVLGASRRNDSQRGRPSKSGEWLLTACEGGGNSPIQSATSGYSAQASHRTADAPSHLSNRPTQSSGRAMELIRKRRLTVVRRITEIPALDKLHEESERGGSRDV
ncbi:hypothetical protein TcBrA4_0096030 [Trypanosoma cruzi]|nr:hypothetical protein TcBrA4_0096030 [Trypanosoma cruzi]